MASTGEYHDQTSVEGRVFEIKRRAGSLLRSWVENSLEFKNQDKDIETLTERVSKFVPEISEELAQKIRTLGNVDDREQFISNVTEILTQLLATHLSLDELEQRVRLVQTTDLEYHTLSRGLTFDVYKDAVFLHVPLTFFNSPDQAIQSFVDGLKELAQRLQTDESLADITEVIGHSDLVKHKHTLATKLGFTVTKDEKGRPTHEAKMSKEKLLELYGS